MKLIDIKTIRDANGKLPFATWLKTTLSDGFGWQAELDAQDIVAERFGRALGDEFSLLRGVELPGLDTPIPMVLVGPSGVYVLLASAAKGTYRARGDVWLVLDGSGNMRNARPNLPTRTRLYADAVKKFLRKNGFTLMDVEAVLLFSRTDAFVENIKAPIRVVLSDGIDNYSSSLRLMHPLFKPEEISTIVRLLSNPEGKTKTGIPDAAREEITAQDVVMPTETESPEGAAVSESDLREMFAEAAEGPYQSVFSTPLAGSATSGKLPAPPTPIAPAPMASGKPPAPAPKSVRSPAGLIASLRLSRPQCLVLFLAALIDGFTICLLSVVVVLSLLQ